MIKFTNFVIRHEYAALRLRMIARVRSALINRDASRPLIAVLYTNAEDRGGHPNYDVVLVIPATGVTAVV